MWLAVNCLSNAVTTKPNHLLNDASPSLLSVRITRHKPSSLSAEERAKLEAFVRQFIDYPHEKFESVLGAAEYLWQCRDAAGALVGTTAVRPVPVRVNSREATVLLTTIVAIHPTYRRLRILPLLGARTFLLERLRAPFRALYWMAFTASPSAYLQLTRNCPVGWPRVGQKTPTTMRALMLDVVRYLGVEQYEELEDGVRLSDDFGVSDWRQHPQLWDRSDPDVDYFLRMNPRYQTGSDLAVLCPLDTAQAMGFVFRALRGGRRTAPHKAATLASK